MVVEDWSTVGQRLVVVKGRWLLIACWLLVVTHLVGCWMVVVLSWWWLIVDWLVLVDGC